MDTNMPVVFSNAIQGLEQNFMTMEELTEAGEKGDLIIEEHIWGYDVIFQMKYPEHPMSEGRYIRIWAADTIRDLAQERTQPFPLETLSKLHRSLFDCCATVRLSIAEALYFAGDRSSVPFLKNLLEQEYESNMVIKQAKHTLEKLSSASYLTISE